ncbi:MAG: OadG family protein [Anaerolineales bacterium]|nr:OadG family protein [Anaerolineales bacterium]
MSGLHLALQITAFGMGLVFFAIVILWLMMTLLTAITTDKEPASDSAEPDSVSKDDVLAQAAAIGVTMAIAEQQLSSAHPLKEPPTAIVSAWQLGMRTRQMTQKGNRLPKS